MVQLRDVIQQFGIRRDSWSMDYESAVQLDSVEPTQEQNIDINLEFSQEQWRAISSSLGQAEALAAATPFIVVDGVRRMHMRLFFEHDDILKYGGLGTAVVGALKIEPGKMLSLKDALVVPPLVKRYALLGELPLNLANEAQIEGIPHPFHPTYIHKVKDSNQPEAPIQALQQAMREQEKQLVNTLQKQFGQGILLIDGPLRLFHSTHSTNRIVGYIKTLHTQYLPAPQQSLLSQLKKGERTPLFVIGEKVAWYLCLGELSPIDHPLTGLVRLEVKSNSPETDLPEIKNLAAQLAIVLPMLVTPRYKDPRSPQNLEPIQALEQHLKSLIGNETLIQRLLDTFFHHIHQGA